MINTTFILFMSISCIVFWSIHRSFGFHLTCTLILTFFISSFLFQYPWYSTYSFSIKALITIVISVFIFFSFQQVAIWLQQAPDTMKFFSSVLLSISLFMISPDTIGAITSGSLGGMLIGFYLEHIKLRAQINDDSKSKIFASLIGLFVYISISLLNVTIHLSPISLYLINILIGLWISYFSIILFVKLKFYKERKITASFSHSSTL